MYAAVALEHPGLGLIDHIFARMRVKAVATVEWRSLTEFSIHYRW